MQGQSTPHAVRRVHSASSWRHDRGGVRVQPQIQKHLRDQSQILKQQPHHPLPRLNENGETLLSAVLNESTSLFDACAAQLASVGWVAIRVGLAHSELSAVAEEGMKAYPRMVCGKVVHPLTGKVREGVDPAGVKRGDRFALVHDEAAFPDGAAKWPALFAMDDTMTTLAVKLAAAVEKERRLPFTLQGRSDAMIACFPGGGTEYGAHLDSNLEGSAQHGLDPRKVTSILYLNEDWKEVDGGALCLHDPRQLCWHTVLPQADTLVFFRADRVLHRVAPCHRWRLALTVFLSGTYRDRIV